MRLLQLQREFCEVLVSRRHTDVPAAIHSAVKGDAAAGLGVYCNAYRLCLGEALRDTFDKTWAFLGDMLFSEAVSAYVETHISRSWTLADYGDCFPAMLYRIYPDDPVIGELASLEWELRKAFEGYDSEPLTSVDLNEVDWDSVVLNFVPTMRLLPVVTNCGAIWSAAAAGISPPPAAAKLVQPAALCVWRKHLAPSFRTLELREYRALRLALSGVSFGRLCALMGERGVNGEEMAAEVGTMLGRWLKDEMLAGFASDSDN